MKKRFTVIAGFLFATGASFSQVAINVPQKQMTSANVGIELFNGKVETTNQGAPKAGGDIVWSSDFSDPTDWTIGTSGQGTFQIGTTPAIGGLGAMTSTTAANGYAYFNGIQYLISTPAAVDPQNTWVATPSIDFTGITSVDFIFQQRYRAFNSDVTMVEFSADGGTTWTITEIVNATITTNAPSIQNTITLTFNVAGTADGMFRFRWENPSDDNQYGSGYGWIVDDVSIVEGYQDNVSMGLTYTSIGAQALSYTKMPVGQTSGAGNVSFGAEVRNTGTNANDISLNVTSGAYNYTGSSVNIASFTTDSVAILTANGMAVPTTVGASNFTYTAVAGTGVTLEQTGDDSKVVNFEVTNYSYATDAYDGTPASITGSFTGWQGGTGDPAVGTLYEVFNTASLTAFQVGVAPVAAANQGTYNGNQFFVKLFKYNAGTDDFEYVEETDAHALVAADYGTLVPFVLGSPITVDAGLYLVVASFYNGSPVPVGMAGTSIAGSTLGMDGADFIRLASDAATPNIVRTPVIRLSFDPSVGVDKVAKDENNVTVFPNPFDAQTDVQFTVSASASVAVSVTDVMGREVISVPAANYASGTHTISLNGTNLEAGLYNYTITIGNNVVTKRIIKK